MHVGTTHLPKSGGKNQHNNVSLKPHLHWFC